MKGFSVYKFVFPSWCKVDEMTWLEFDNKGVIETEAAQKAIECQHISKAARFVNSTYLYYVLCC